MCELERHYSELTEQKKRLEEMVEKTDRMMRGVKRGLDEMRGVAPVTSAGASASAAPSPSAAPVNAGGEGDDVDADADASADDGSGDRAFTPERTFARSPLGSSQPTLAQHQGHGSPASRHGDDAGSVNGSVNGSVASIQSSTSTVVGEGMSKSVPMMLPIHREHRAETIKTLGMGMGMTGGNVWPVTMVGGGDVAMRS